MENLPPVHNPDNLTPEQIGAKDGWRLLRMDEEIPEDAQSMATHNYKTIIWAPVTEIGLKGNVFWSLPGLRTRKPDMDFKVRQAALDEKAFDEYAAADALLAARKAQP